MLTSLLPRILARLSQDPLTIHSLAGASKRFEFSFEMKSGDDLPLPLGEGRGEGLSGDR
jgi:hypothetical protein